MLPNITSQNNVAVGLLATKEIHTCVLITNFSRNDVWIVDSGVSDHMPKEIFIGGLQIIQRKLNYKDSSDSFSKERIGLVYLTNKLVLKIVLYVACNLQLVSKLVKDLNCIAKFYL